MEKKIWLLGRNITYSLLPPPTFCTGCECPLTRFIACRTAWMHGVGCLYSGKVTIRASIGRIPGIYIPQHMINLSSSITDLQYPHTNRTLLPGFWKKTSKVQSPTAESPRLPAQWASWGKTPFCSTLEAERKKGDSSSLRLSRDVYFSFRKEHTVLTPLPAVLLLPWPWGVLFGTQSFDSWLCDCK